MVPKEKGEQLYNIFDMIIYSMLLTLKRRTSGVGTD
jgi:hypothetical protein